jgi:hypothetical protein
VGGWDAIRGLAAKIEVIRQRFLAARLSSWRRVANDVANETCDELCCVGLVRGRGRAARLNLVLKFSSILRESPCSQGASWVVCGSAVPPYDFLNLYGIFSRRFSIGFFLRNGSN